MHERELFMAALQIEDAAERSAYLERACAGDSALRERVETLLAAFEKAGSFLQQPAADPQATSDVPHSGPSNPSEPTAGSGTVIGPYKLLEQIGEGGMGTVWMAQQTEPVKRVVALKLIKAGMDSKQVIARFEAERQALALMDHPNIAKVLDAGTVGQTFLSAGGEKGVRAVFRPTHDVGLAEELGPKNRSDTCFGGRPYFVMELVKGVPITKYCDEHRLTPRQRLELFIPVCQAIQHAHQKGIIHRDLKPSNVLVALYDGRPMPKVIDFGVAKAAGQPLTEQTLVTGFGAIVGTLEYMSPEQAEINQLDIDTRSDIYSLGVLLYELLAGSPPFSRKDLEKAGMLEMLRMIREEEPSKPSTKLSTAEGLPTLAANRGTEPAKLTKLVRGELDWIVMKCLEKDRNRRYETANGFAADVQRYLHDEPVQACPPSVGYRFRKFVRRNKGPVLAAVLLVFALLGGILGTTFGLIRADQARRDEAKQRQQAEEYLQLARQAVDKMYSDVAEKWLAHEPRLTPLQAEFLEEALKFYTSFAQESGSDPEVKQRTALAYQRVGQIQRKLGNYKPAEGAFGRAIPLLQELVNECPTDARYGRELAGTCNNLALLLIDAGRREEAEQAFRRALALRQKLAADHSNVPGYAMDVADVFNNLGSLLKEQTGRQQEAEQVYRQCVTLFDRIPADFQNANDYSSRRAAVLSNLASLLRNRGELIEARKLTEQAIQHQETALKSNPRNTTYANFLSIHYANLAETLVRLGDYDGAETALRRAIVVAEKLARDFPEVSEQRYGLAVEYRRLGNLLQSVGHHKEAVDVFRQAITLLKKLADEFPTQMSYRGELGANYNDLANSLQRTGQWQDAEQSYNQAITLFEKLRVDSSADSRYREWLGNAYNNLGNMLKNHKRFQEAERAHQQASRLHRELVTEFPDNPGHQNRLASSYLNLGSLLLATGKHLEAENVTLQAIALCRKLVHDFPKDAEYKEDLALGHNNLASALAAGNKRQQAEQHLRQAVLIYQKLITLFPKRPANRHELARSYANLGLVLKNSGHLREAEQAHREALGLQAKLVAEFPAMPDYRQALVTSHRRLAELLVEVRRYGEAAEQWRRLLQVLPESPNALNAFAWFLATCPDSQVRNPGEAVKLGTKVTELAPQVGGFWNTLGVANYRTGNWKAAVASLDKSVQLQNGGDSFDWFFLAMAHWQLGDKEQARKHYDQAVQWMEKNQPQNEELVRFRAEAAELLGLPQPPKQVNVPKKDERKPPSKK